MAKKFIATVLAASIAFTSVSVAPARAADSGEIGRLILGAGALIIIGSAIANSNNNTTVTRHQPRVIHRPHVTPRHRKVAPAACVRNSKWERGPRRILTRGCVNKNMRHADRLPNVCKTRIKGKNGARTVFGAKCLRNHGWTFG